MGTIRIVFEDVVFAKRQIEKRKKLQKNALGALKFLSKCLVQLSVNFSDKGRSDPIGHIPLKKWAKYATIIIIR